MPRTPGGVHCSRCDRDVLDLRRVPRKRALAVLAEKRATEGKVCAWVRATPDGTPVFAADPSRLARFAGPAIVASALTACGASATERHAAPIAFVEPVTAAPTAPSSGGNTNAVPAPVVASVISTSSPVQPASNVQRIEIEMAGDMSF